MIDSHEPGNTPEKKERRNKTPSFFIAENLRRTWENSPTLLASFPRSDRIRYFVVSCLIVKKGFVLSLIKGYIGMCLFGRLPDARQSSASDNRRLRYCCLWSAGKKVWATSLFVPQLACLLTTIPCSLCSRQASSLSAKILF